MTMGRGLGRGGGRAMGGGGGYGRSLSLPGTVLATVRGIAG